MPAPSPLPHFSETTSIKVSVRADSGQTSLNATNVSSGTFVILLNHFAKSDDSVWRISHDLVFNK